MANLNKIVCMKKFEIRNDSCIERNHEPLIKSIWELENAIKVEGYAPIETKEYEIYPDFKGYPIRSYRNIDREGNRFLFLSIVDFKTEV